MISSIRSLFAQSAFILILTVFITGPVIQAEQAKAMRALMDTVMMSEVSVNSKQPCQNCIEKENKEICTSSCLSGATAILPIIPDHHSQKSNQPPYVRVLQMQEYIPDLELTPPRS
ncbi:hypothetical protein [Kiloniella antarctica]|uniref:Uncharacterized protein n=1 Tax=Kiloniella antarctica TaxID=1550907 RepID=A0ABW5BLN6_9PROT